MLHVKKVFNPSDVDHSFNTYSSTTFRGLRTVGVGARVGGRRHPHPSTMLQPSRGCGSHTKALRPPGQCTCPPLPAAPFPGREAGLFLDTPPARLKLPPGVRAFSIFTARPCKYPLSGLTDGDATTLVTRHLEKTEFGRTRLGGLAR